MPFEWTINPYRSCEIGCRYCYARYTHEFMELDPDVDFETKIFVKQWNSAEFRRELHTIPRHEVIALDRLNAALSYSANAGRICFRKRLTVGVDYKVRFDSSWDEEDNNTKMFNEQRRLCPCQPQRRAVPHSS